MENTVNVFQMSFATFYICVEFAKSQIDKEAPYSKEYRIHLWKQWFTYTWSIETY